MPAISDPGAELVRDALAAGFPVIPVPGANAALTALIASGLPTASFTFVGFLPRDKKKRQLELERLRHYPETLLVYEAPHRIQKTLQAMLDVWGDRKAAIARELSKRYEEFARGTLAELLAWLNEAEVRGEYCIVVEGAQPSTHTETTTEAAAWWERLTITEHVERYCAQGMSKKEAVRQTALDRGLAKRDVYNQYHRT
jgi:16S rRNA (cytidine1402-2'-O)-methyltransferase